MTKKPKRTDPLAFLRSVRVELGLVKWPNRQETIRLTSIVIFMSILIGVYIGGLDFLFTKLISLLITQ